MKLKIDRNFWKLQFEKDKFPVWTCSTCGKGILELQLDTFHREETGESKMSRDCEAWEPEWSKFRFCAFLKCNNGNCQETATLTGSGRLFEGIPKPEDICIYEEIDPGGRPLVFVEKFLPEYCSPPPLVFEIPAMTLEEVKTRILESFSVFLSQPDSAGNKIRTCLEDLLTSQKINKIEITKKRKREKLSLHKRIIKLGEQFPDLGKNILAIKWLGNSASHTSGLTIDDIFDAYEILHHVLNEIYVNRHKHINKLTNAINKRKGSRGKIN